MGWFLLAWLGYGQLIHQLRSPRSITWRLRGIRRAWMNTMLGRDNRITDAALLGHVVHSTTFFASTMVVVLAALLGVLAGFDHGFTALMELAFTAKTSRAHAWLLGPGAFALAITGIVAMLLWRQFGSETAEEIRLSHIVLMGEAAAADERDDPAARGLRPGAYSPTSMDVP